MEATVVYHETQDCFDARLIMFYENNVDVHKFSTFYLTHVYIYISILTQFWTYVMHIRMIYHDYTV